MNNAKEFLSVTSLPGKQEAIPQRRGKLAKRVFKLSWLLVYILLSPGLVSAQQSDQEAAQPSSGTEPTTNGRLLPKPAEQSLALLAKAQSPDTEPVWLETQKESFLGLYQSANNPNPTGGVIILHHDRTSPDWPYLIHALRTNLPDQGWKTLSIAVPEEPKPVLPTRSTNADAPPPEVDYDNFAESIFERIESGLAHLESKDAKRFMLIGIGSSAYWSSRYATQAGTQRPLSLTMIDALPPTGKVEPPLRTAVTELSIPTMDLFHGSGLNRTQVEKQARLRINEIRRKGKKNYIQRRLPPTPSATGLEEKRLLSSFRGLFEKHLKDMQPLKKNGQSNSDKTPEQAPGQ